MEGSWNWSRNVLVKNYKLPLNARIKLAAETLYTCDVCHKKYLHKTSLKKHIQIKHTPGGIQPKHTDGIKNQSVAIIVPMVPIQPIATTASTADSSASQSKNVDLEEEKLWMIRVRMQRMS